MTSEYFCNHNVYSIQMKLWQNGVNINYRLHFAEVALIRYVKASVIWYSWLL